MTKERIRSLEGGYLDLHNKTSYLWGPFKSLKNILESRKNSLNSDEIMGLRYIEDYLNDSVRNLKNVIKGQEFVLVNSTPYIKELTECIYGNRIVSNDEAESVFHSFLTFILDLKQLERNPSEFYSSSNCSHILDVASKMEGLFKPEEIYHNPTGGNSPWEL